MWSCTRPRTHRICTGAVFLEYRRTRRTLTKLPQGNNVFPVAVIALTFLAVVYILGVSRLGGWLAETFVAPVFRIAGDADESGVAKAAGGADSRQEGAGVSAAEAAASLPTESLTVPAFSLYALQMGIFSSEDNAKAQAAQLRELGAGGYVMTDSGRYRVLAAGYADAESLKKVRSQLAGEGLESASYTVTLAEGAWRVTASAEALRAYQAAVTHLGGLAEELTALALAFDKEEQSVPDGLRALALLEGELKRRQSAYSQAVTETDAQSAAISDCFAGAVAELSLLAEMDESDRPDFSAALKHAQLRIALSVAALFQTLGG